jgi:hypothetical protein
MKHDSDEAAGEDTSDDEGDVLPHLVVGATKGIDHGGTKER